MWGFLLGTLALAAGYTLVQKGSVDRVSAGSGAIVNLLNSFLSETKPGIRKLKAAAAAPVGNSSTAINPATGLPNAFNNVVIPGPGGPAGSPGPGSGSGPGT